MKSLQKSLKVLEYVMNHGGEPVTPSEVANALELNASNCVRIMTDYTEAGYLEQVSRRTGYIPGPTLFLFSTCRDWNYSRLIEAAREPVRDLALKLGTVVNISVMVDGFKYILYHFGPQGMKTIALKTRHSDHYITASGRLLLSELPENQLEKIVERLGFPEESWNGISSLSDFKNELKKLAKQNSICFQNNPNPQWIIGAKITAKNYPAAAIGFGYNNDDYMDAVEAACDTAKQIEYNLKPVTFS